MDGETSTATVETTRTNWGVWCRIARYMPEDDTVTWAERAPRHPAPGGRGCVYVVPAHEGAVIGWLDQNDYRQEHMAWDLRRGGEWHRVTKEEAFEALSPGITERCRIARERREAEWQHYRLRCYRQPKGAFKYEDGVYRFPDGVIRSVDRLSRGYFYARGCSPEEIAHYEESERRWAEEDAAAAAESAPAA